MGYFKKISFLNYRNFEESSFSFELGCNIIVGENGSGKTNILEGISLSEKGTGLRKDKINNLSNFNNIDYSFKVNSIFNNQQSDIKICIHNNEQKLKRISVNENYDNESIKHFNSLFSIIYFLPEMERLFISSPSSRRNFIDRLIFNFFKEYNSIINKYKKLIRERQILLKNSFFDENWMTEIEKNIAMFGLIIYKRRIECLSRINLYLSKLNIVKNFSNHFYLSIEDQFLANYDVLNNDEKYLSYLSKNRKVDLFAGGCTIGPHRSDIIGFKIDSKFNLNQFSTGQQKTAILLIIIAQCKYLIEEINIQPIILLDEICSHLDNTNRELLLYLINKLDVQVFMTGTEKELFSFLSTKANYCNIN